MSIPLKFIDSTIFEVLKEKIETNKAIIGVIGLGYVFALSCRESQSKYYKTKNTPQGCR